MKTRKILTSLTAVLLFSVLTATANNKAGKVTNGPDKQLLLDLVTVDPGNFETYVDGLAVRYNTGYLASTADDIDKISRAGENIASYREVRDLSDEKRPLFYSTDTIFLHITNTGIRDYRFKIIMQQFSVTGLMAKVDDNYLHTSTLLDTYGSITNIDFSVTADPASADPFRFTIVIITARPLPVNITKFAATQQAKNIALEWKVSNQLNMLKYEVERSTNGINFTTAAVQSAIAGNSYTYNWVDEHTTTGNNFYRIRCVGITGSTSYSTIVNVKMGSDFSGINIYPNPVINNIIALQFTGMQKGIYNLRLLSSMGQVLFTNSINLNSSNSTQTVTPLGNMAKGNYYLEIVGPDNFKVSKSISVAK
jgi:hypothetical protein